MSAGSYHTLVPNVAYLRNFGALSDDNDTKGGVSQPDLTQCELDAYREIRSRLINKYDVGTWDSSTPDIIDTLGNLLGSAYAFAMKNASEGFADAGPTASSIRSWAHEIMDALNEGRSEVVLADGSIQSRRLAGTRGSLSKQ